MWPVAGPRDGGSVLDVTGAGFADLGGVYCRFGCGGAVNATLVSTSLLRCVSPACAAPQPARASSALWPARRQDELVQVTLNAQEYTTSTATFSAYEQSLVRVSALVPHGGPLAGGTHVVVLGAGFAAFATDHLKCRFGTEVVAAELVNETALVCTSLARDGASLEADGGDAERRRVVALADGGRCGVRLLRRVGGGDRVDGAARRAGGGRDGGDGARQRLCRPRRRLLPVWAVGVGGRGVRRVLGAV